MAVSFEEDIRPLFRDSPDVDSMKEYGLDLSLNLPKRPTEALHRGSLSLGKFVFALNLVGDCTA